VACQATELPAAAQREHVGVAPLVHSHGLVGHSKFVDNMCVSRALLRSAGL
jgi:hypothetical protein